MFGINYYVPSALNREEVEYPACPAKSGLTGLLMITPLALQLIIGHYSKYISPFQGFGFHSILCPGRCPGLGYIAPSGLNI